MLFPILIIHQRVLMQFPMYRLVINDNIPLSQSIDHQLQDIQQFSGITATIRDHGLFLLHRDITLAQVIILGDGTVYQVFEILFLLRL